MYTASAKDRGHEMQDEGTAWYIQKRLCSLWLIKLNQSTVCMIPSPSVQNGKLTCIQWWTKMLNWHYFVESLIYCLSTVGISYAISCTCTVHSGVRLVWSCNGTRKCQEPDLCHSSGSQSYGQ